MSMMDFALLVPRKWYAEGFERGQARERRRSIDAIIADPVMSDEAKLQAIAAINAMPMDYYTDHRKL